MDSIRVSWNEIIQELMDWQGLGGTYTLLFLFLGLLMGGMAQSSKLILS